MIKDDIDDLLFKAHRNLVNAKMLAFHSEELKAKMVVICELIEVVAQENRLAWQNKDIAEVKQIENELFS